MPKRSTPQTQPGATAIRRAEEARARRIEALHQTIQRQAEKINRLLDTGEFWKPVRKVKNKPASKAAPTYVVARLGAVTVTSDMPLIPYRYPTFKDKVKTEGSPLSGKIAFTYSKPDGETTQRTVLLKSAYPTGQAQYLVGHCELRNEERTFAVDRMSAAVDLSTGREIPDVQQWLVCAAK